MQWIRCTPLDSEKYFILTHPVYVCAPGQLPSVPTRQDGPGMKRTIAIREIADDFVKK